MVEVFKTNVAERQAADQVLRHLCLHFPDLEINFDLEDCDKILRVQSPFLAPCLQIISELGRLGYFCELLPD